MENTEFTPGVRAALVSVVTRDRTEEEAKASLEELRRLLETAVRQLKNNEEIVEEMPITIDLQQDSYIPEKYIADADTRIDVYKTISQIETEEDADTVISQLIDRFGEPPKVMESLIDAVLIRNLAKSLGVTYASSSGLIVTGNAKKKESKAETRKT